MTTITVICDGCAYTGDATHEDRHTGTNMDRCRKCGGQGKIPARTGETPEAPFQPPPDFKTALLALSYQERVRMWLHACFGEQISADPVERNHRFLEEALEFVQACDCTRSEAHQLVDYVFGRPVGEKGQEAGGVMNTFAAACLAHGIVMTEVAETELARCWVKIDKIREKQRNKPKHSPLPEAAAPVDLGQVAYEERWQGFTHFPIWADVTEEGKQVWRRVALAARNAPWPPATPGRILPQVDQGVEGLWYVTSPAPAGLLVAGETMRGALDQVERALEDMKRATAEVGGDAILVDEAVAKEAIGVAKTLEAAQAVQRLEGSALLEALGGFLHDEIHADNESGWTWPLHAEDDGYRGNNAFVTITPADVQARRREEAGRILRFLEPRTSTEARSFEAACEPWRFGLGGPPDNGSPLANVFDAGVTYAIRELAVLTKSAGWSQQDGSEDHRNDVIATLLDVLKHAGLYDEDTSRLATLTSVNDQGRTQVEEALTAQIRALEEQIRKDASDAFTMKRDLDLELDALRLLLRRNEVRVGRQRELLQENNKLLDRARAADARAARFWAALRCLFPFVDRAVGEGIVFGPDGKAPAMDALDVYAAAGRALEFEAVDDSALMALSAPGDTPEAAATVVPVLYLNYRGDIAPRHIVPIRFWEGESEWHPGERHFLRVVEPSTRKVRDFALAGILAWGQAAIDQLESNDRAFQMLRDDLGAERDAKVCGEIEVRRHGLDPADPDSLHLRIAISQQQLISDGPQILDPILEKAKAELSIVMTAREAQAARGAR